MNKKNIVWIIAFILVIVACFIGGMLYKKPKKEETKKEEKTEQKEQKDFSYMPITYKVCDEDSCIHITGSFHIGDKRIKKLDQKLIDVYNQADYLALEIKEDSTNLSDYLIGEGKTIQDIVSPELYEKLEKFSQEHPTYALEFYKRYNLGMNATILDLLPFLEAKAQTSGIDAIFQNKAERDGKEILTFETLEYQFNLLMGSPNELYISMIEDIIDNYDEIAEYQFETYEAYLSGDEEKFTELIAADEVNEETASQAEIDYYNELYTNRNNRMTETIKEYLKDNKNVYVVVGAAHVLPEGGILDQLRKTNNYKITRVE